MNNVRISLPRIGCSEVFIDGVRIDCVNSLTVSAGKEDFNEVMLKFNAGSVEIDGDFSLVIER